MSTYVNLTDEKSENGSPSSSKEKPNQKKTPPKSPDDPKNEKKGYKEGKMLKSAKDKLKENISRDKIVDSNNSKLKSETNRNPNHEATLEKIKKKKSRPDNANEKTMEELRNICDERIRKLPFDKKSIPSNYNFKKCLEEIVDVSSYSIAPKAYDINEKMTSLFLTPDSSEIIYLSADRIKMIDYAKIKSGLKELKTIPLPLKKNIDYLSMNSKGFFMAADSKDIMVIDWKSKNVLHSFEHKLFDNAFNNKYSEKITYLVSDSKTSIIASCSNGPNKHKIGLWFTEDHEKHRHLIHYDHDDAAKSLAFFPDDIRIISGHVTGKLIIWSIETKKQLLTLDSQHKSGVHAIFMNSNGNQIITGGNDEEILVWNSIDSLNFKVNPALIMKVASPIHTLYMFPNNQYLLSGCKNKLYIWNMKNGLKVCNLDGNKTAFITRDGQRVFSAFKNSLLMWDIIEKGDVFSTNPHENDKDCSITQLLSVSDKEMLISSGKNQSVRVWDAKTDDLLSEINNVGIPDHINPIAIFDDYSKIISLDKNSSNDLTIWDIRTGEITHTFNYHKSMINFVVIGKEDTVYSLSADGFLVKWVKEKNGRYKCEEFGVHKNNTVLAIDNQKSKSILASGAMDGSLKIWIDGDSIKQLNEHVKSITSIAFAHNNEKSLMFSGGYDRKIVIWEMNTWEKKKVISKDLGEIRTLTISDHDKQVSKLIHTEGQKLKLWDIDYNKFNLIPGLEQIEDYNITTITTIKSKIFIGTNEGKIHKLNFEKFDHHRDEIIHVDKFKAVAVIKDSYQIATAINKNLYIWDIKTMKSCQFFPNKHDSSIEMLAISRKDTKYIVSATKGDITRLFLWNYQTMKFIQEIKWINNRKQKPKRKILPFPTFLEVYQNLIIGLIEIKSGREKNESKLVVYLIPDNKENEDLLLIPPSSEKASDLKQQIEMKVTLEPENLTLGRILSMKVMEIENEVKIVTTGIVSSSIRQGVITIYDIEIGEEIDKKIDVKFGIGDLINTHEDIPLMLEFLPNDFDMAFTVNENKTISIWNLHIDSCMARIPIDFKVKSLSFLTNSDKILGFINSLFFDFENNQFVNLRKFSNDKNSQIIHLQNNDYILLNENNIVERHNNIFCTYNNLNILSSVNSLESLKRIDVHQTEEIDKGVELIFPYYFNYLHLITITSNKEPFRINELTKLRPNINVFMAENAFGKDCFEMILANNKETNKETFKNLLDLLLKTLAHKQVLASEKALYFKNHLSEKETDFKFLDEAFEYYGSQTLEHFLDQTAIDFDSFVEGIEMPSMKKPIYYILKTIHPIDCSDLKQMLILENQKNKQGIIKKVGIFFLEWFSLKKKEIIDLRPLEATNEKLEPKFKLDSNEILVNVKCRFICLENLVEINEQVIDFTDNILNLEPTNQIFCNNVLWTFIHYKWHSYAFYIFLRQFLLFILMFVLYMVNFFYFYVERFSYSDSDQNLSIPNLICCFLLFIYFIIYLYGEFREFKSAPLQYLSSIYNAIDLSLVFFGNGALILDVLYIFNIFDEIAYLQKFVSISMFLFWMRIISFLRGLEGTSFMINLIVQVIKDIKYFLLLMFLVMFSFISAAYFMQNFGTDDSFDFVSIFTVFYRLLLGDFNQYDNVVVDDSSFLWFVMLLFTVICVIVLLNLLISIISDSFQNVYKLKDQTRTYELMSLINDIDRQISNASRQYLRENAHIGNYLFKFYTENEKIEKDLEYETYHTVQKIEKQMGFMMEQIKILQDAKKIKNLE